MVKQYKKPRKVEEILKDIINLVKEPGYIYSFTLLLYECMVVDPLKVEKEGNDFSVLHFNELGLLGGYMVKNDIVFDVIEQEKIQTYYDKSKLLLEELHGSYTASFFDIPKKLIKSGSTDAIAEQMQNNLKAGKALVETIFYGESGMYDFQCVEFTLKRYEKDKEWLAAQNISIEVFKDIFQHLKKTIEDNFNKLKISKGGGVDLFQMFSTFCFNRKTLEKFDQVTVEKFLSLFSIKPGKCNEHYLVPNQYNELESRPIIDFGKSYFLPIAFYLGKSIYESPMYWIEDDEKYYETAIANKGKKLEDITYELLIKVFGKDHVYQNVLVKRGKNIITDIDVLVIFGNKALIFQAKANKLTEPAKMGDDEKIMVDFKKSIQKAYEQGLACQKAIDDPSISFITNDGNTLSLRSVIKDSYLLATTLDHYPSSAHQVKSYLQKPDINDPDMLVLSVFDLDLVTYYLSDPFEFIYYIHQRISLFDYFMSDSEIAMLGYHLKMKLFKRPGYNGAAIDSDMAQWIDYDQVANRGGYKKLKPTGEYKAAWKNEKFDTIVNQLKDTDSPDLLDAVMFLYDWAGDGADKYIESIENAKQKSRQNMGLHSVSIPSSDGTGVSYICLPKSSSRDVGEINLGFSRTKKYTTKSDIWLGLGSYCESDNLVDTCCFSKEPWQLDPQEEKLSNILLKPGTLIVNKKPGRNEKCPCGSGLKYKKCCYLRGN